jgi:hypothetical protein
MGDIVWRRRPRPKQPLVALTAANGAGVTRFFSYLTTISEAGWSANRPSFEIAAKAHCPKSDTTPYFRFTDPSPEQGIYTPSKQGFHRGAASSRYLAEAVQPLRCIEQMKGSLFRQLVG